MMEREWSFLREDGTERGTVRSREHAGGGTAKRRRAGAGSKGFNLIFVNRLLFLFF